MLMKFEVDGVIVGWHNASPLEEEQMKKDGWIESSEKERQEVIANKFKKPEIVDNTQENDDNTPIREKLRPGRKPNPFKGDLNGNRPNLNKPKP